MQVNGVSVTGMSQPEVVQLLREAQGKVMLLVSRQETIDVQEEEEVRNLPCTEYCACTSS